MARSIHRHLLVWYSLILTVVLGAFGGVVYFELHRTMLRAVDSDLRSHAEGLAGAKEDRMRPFRPPAEGMPYGVIWDAAGDLVDRSDPSVEVPRPEGPGARDRGNLREVAVPGPEGSLILVGKNIRAERDRLREFLVLVLGAGAIVLVLALSGGWFLAGRALAPIEKITRAASAVSVSNLSARIDVAQTESELAQLARTLNETFERLEDAFERQARFTADASHELRTPLSILLSHLELALRRERNPAEYRAALETCLRSAQRMKSVVEGLLTLARADAQEIRLVREKLELPEVVEETLSLLRPLAEERSVALAVEARPVEVVGDRNRLREVVTNLVTNAIRYNRPGGRVDVRVERDDGCAVLRVTDTGVGIPEKDRPHIFGRFFCVDKARCHELGGSGLGLAITKWIVEAHGGTIGFESREGEGTTFTVRLPFS